jgi:hypothetical protein
VTNLTLLGGSLVINGDGIYASEQLTISNAKLDLTFPDMTDPLKFLVDFSVSPSEPSFSIETSSISLPNPFGSNMFSVALDDLGISGEIVKANGETSATYMVSVKSVELGGESTGLGGSVLFPHGKPQGAKLDAMDM